jgi:hypothetical protein
MFVGKVEVTVAMEGLGSGDYLYAGWPLLHDGSYRSAREIIPLVLSYFSQGALLTLVAGQELGYRCAKNSASKTFWLDGDYLDEKILKRPKERCLSFDLRSPFHLVTSYLSDLPNV